MINDLKKITKKQYLILLIFSALWYLITFFFFHGKQVGFHDMFAMVKSGQIGTVLTTYFASLSDGFSGHFGEQRKIVFLIGQLVFFCFLIKPGKFFQGLFKYRWLIGLLLLVFCTANKYHGDSLGMYNYYIQPESSSEFATPILGTVRSIRSDEWAVTTPAKIASSFGEHPFGKYNNILRAADTINGISGIYLGFATLSKNILNYGYAFLDVERAFSFAWCGQIILTFLVSVEFFRILCKRKYGNKTGKNAEVSRGTSTDEMDRKSGLTEHDEKLNNLVASAGAFLVTFSGFYLWWGFPAMLWTSEAALTCFYYFLDNKKRWMKAVFALGFAISFAEFCTILYPAWQVPFGYVALVIAVWIIITKWKDIRRLKIWDYLIFAAGLAFSGILILSYVKLNSDYLTAITNTVYPGKRVSTGGLFISKIFYYAQNLFYAYQEPANASECSAFFSLFPIPILIAIVIWWKDRKNSFCELALSVLSIIFILYCTTGLPLFFCRITMLSNSVNYRVVDAIGYICILLMVRILSYFPTLNFVTEKDDHCIPKDDKNDQKKDDKNVRKITFYVICCSIAVIIAGLSIGICKKSMPDYLTGFQMELSFLILAVTGFGLTQVASVFWKRVSSVLLILISLFTGICVRPLMKGFDAIWEKPVAKEISAIVEEEPDSIWLGMGESIVNQGFLVSCGARCLNSTNSYPNMEMWHTLDPEGSQEDIYNRYCHVGVKLTTDPTNFVLGAADSVLINLNYDDLDKLDVDYLFTGYPVDYEDNSISLEKIYEEYNCYIYRVDVKD